MRTCKDTIYINFEKCIVFMCPIAKPIIIQGQRKLFITDQDPENYFNQMCGQSITLPLLITFFYQLKYKPNRSKNHTATLFIT